MANKLLVILGLGAAVGGVLWFMSKSAQASSKCPDDITLRNMAINLLLQQDPTPPTETEILATMEILRQKLCPSVG